MTRQAQTKNPSQQSGTAQDERKGEIATESVGGLPMWATQSARPAGKMNLKNSDEFITKQGPPASPLSDSIPPLLSFVPTHRVPIVGVHCRAGNAQPKIDRAHRRPQSVLKAFRRADVLCRA